MFGAKEAWTTSPIIAKPLCISVGSTSIKSR